MIAIILLFITTQICGLWLIISNTFKMISAVSSISEKREEGLGRKKTLDRDGVERGWRLKIQGDADTG